MVCLIRNDAIIVTKFISSLCHKIVYNIMDVFVIS